MTSQGPLGGVGMLWYGAPESLWQHNMEEHTDLTFTLDNQGFQMALQWNMDRWDGAFICLPWCEKLIYPVLLICKFALRVTWEMGAWSQDNIHNRAVTEKNIQYILVIFLVIYKFTFWEVQWFNPLAVLLYVQKNKPLPQQRNPLSNLTIFIIFELSARGMTRDSHLNIQIALQTFNDVWKASISIDKLWSVVGKVHFFWKHSFYSVSTPLKTWRVFHPCF